MEPTHVENLDLASISLSRRQDAAIKIPKSKWLTIMRELEVSGIIDGDDPNCPKDCRAKIFNHVDQQEKAFLKEFEPVLVEVKKIFNSKPSTLPSHTTQYLKVLHSMW